MIFFRPATIRARFELATVACAFVMLLPALGGWWSLRSLSAATDAAIATALAKQTLSLRLVSSTMRAVQSGSAYVFRPSQQFRDDFEREGANAHAVASRLNRDHLASADEAELVAHLDRQLSVLESELAQAHAQVNLGDRAGAQLRLGRSAPLEAAVVHDVEHLGQVNAEHVTLVTRSLRKSADGQTLTLLVALVCAAIGLAVLTRWLSHTVAVPLSQLLRQATELGHRNTAASTHPDSVPADFRPLALAMNEAAMTLTRVTTAEEHLQELLARQNEVLAQLRVRSTELQDEVGLRRRAEASAREARHRADAANRAKSAFLARMSHELRTPLNSIIGFATVLLKNRPGNLRTSDLEYLGRVDKNGRHLLQLIDSVLDLSKVEAGRMTADLATLSVETLIRDTVAELEGRVVGVPGAETAAPVLLRTELPATIGPLTTDPMKLKQMIINLVGNALKFTSRGNVTVRLTTDPVSDAPLRIDVSDTGPGIPLDRQAAIFEAFEQVSNHTSRAYGGTGLGLAITRAFADLLGYQITVNSTLGVGSTFSIHLVTPPRMLSTFTTPASTPPSAMAPVRA